MYDNQDIQQTNLSVFSFVKRAFLFIIDKKHVNKEALLCKSEKNNLVINCTFIVFCLLL